MAALRNQNVKQDIHCTRSNVDERRKAGVADRDLEWRKWAGKPALPLRAESAHYGHSSRTRTSPLSSGATTTAGGMLEQARTVLTKIGAPSVISS